MYVHKRSQDPIKGYKKGVCVGGDGEKKGLGKQKTLLKVPNKQHPLKRYIHT